jgi:GR25 family glycosyltransferase involved in LPS biosynthesis
VCKNECLVYALLKILIYTQANFISKQEKYYKVNILCMIDCKFYIIHNLEEDRYNNVMHLLEKNNIPTSKIEFINHPNKNELTIDIKRKAVQKNAKIKDGWISCSYKHYLALEKIVHGSEEFGVIMEDNIGSFYENIYERLSKYLDELPKDWEILYDSVWGDYSLLDEEVVTTEKLVYKKSNEVSKDINGKIISHGGTRAAQFYFVNKVGAKKLYDNFLPFNHSADMWMNDVLRKANINSFWSEPSLVVSKFNSKTSTNLSLKNNLFYILKSKFHNYRLGI